MPVTFIDYTALYYTQIANIPVPAVVTGKFVQVRNEATLYLIFSPKEFTKYHANIVERFCMDRGLEGNFNPEGTKFIIADHAWQVVGGGKFERDRERKFLRLSDTSLAYGKFLKEGLRETIRALPELSGFQVRIA